MDSGADVSCIAGKDWSSSELVHSSSSSLMGLGLADNMAQNSQILTWEDGDDKGTFCPYVLPALPYSLWGRDRQGEMDVRMTKRKNMPNQKLFILGAAV